MKNTNTPEYHTFTDLIANKKLTKENMHEAIEMVAGKYLGFQSTAYQLDCHSNGTEVVSLFAHYHGGKTYCGLAIIDKYTPALEAISTALVKLNENIHKDFQAPLRCIAVQNHGGEVITDTFLSENETSDLREFYAA